MSVSLEKEMPRMKSAPKKREDVYAWRVNDDEVRVQINQPDVARAFAKVNGVWPAGYSVAGNFMRIFHVKKSVPWVEAWMKEFNGRVNVGATAKKEAR